MTSATAINSTDSITRIYVIQTRTLIRHLFTQCLIYQCRDYRLNLIKHLPPNPCLSTACHKSEMAENVAQRDSLVVGILMRCTAAYLLLTCRITQANHNCCKCTIISELRQLLSTITIHKSGYRQRHKGRTERVTFPDWSQLVLLSFFQCVDTVDWVTNKHQIYINVCVNCPSRLFSRTGER